MRGIRSEPGETSLNSFAEWPSGMGNRCRSAAVDQRLSIRTIYPLKSKVARAIRATTRSLTASAFVLALTYTAMAS